MCKCLFLGLMLLIATPVMASVTGTVLGTQQDSNGAIIVKVNYKIDGVQLPSGVGAFETQYPLENGVSYKVFRISFENLEGLTQAQVGELIDKNVRDYATSLVAQKGRADINSKLDFSGFVGRSVKVDTADIQVSPTKAYTVGTLGVISAKTLTPIKEPIEAIAK